MKNWKKVTAFALAVMMSMALAACGSSDKGSSEGTTESAITSKEDLKGKVIGVQLGTTGDLEASKEEYGAKEVKRFSKGSEAVQALKSGQVDCVIIDSQPASLLRRMMI